MKIIVLFLACIAAANATSYSYDYWCSHNFVVYPPTCSYHYTVYFPDTWCSCAYYNPILKVYPGDDCGGHCWSETPVSTLVGQVRSLLAAELRKMSSQMYAHRDQFMRTLEAIHAQFKADFRKYISRWYSYRYQCNGIVYVGGGYIVERDGRIQEYCAKLDEIRKNVYDNYTAAIVAKVEALKKYHALIVERAEKALTTRLQKISEYRTQLCAKIDQYVAKFLQYHLAIADKNAAGYRKVWQTLLGGEGSWFIRLKVGILMNEYHQQQRQLVYSLRNQYRSKISAYKSDLITYYTCAYKVAFGSSCLTFNQKCYYQSCKKLGCWYAYKSDYKCVAFKLGPYKYDLKLPTYKCLKTCDVDAVVGSVDGVVADLKQKMEKALAERQAQYDAWRRKWVGYHIQYKAAFARIVMIRHNWYCMYMQKQYTDCHGVISFYNQARIAELKQQLLRQASQVCANYWQQLIANLNAADESHAKAQAQFRETVNKLIDQIEKSFNTCKSKRVTAIADYKTKLQEKVAEQRRKLISMLSDVKNKHYANFVKMLKFYHGENAFSDWLIRWARDCYVHEFLYAECNAVLHEFDCFWQVKIPQLVQHFSCGYTCKVATKCLPTYSCGAYYQWHFCLPEPSSYCYQYDLWQRYYCA